MSATPVFLPCTTDLLTAEDERELAQRMEAGREARDRLETGEGLDGDDELVAAADAARNRFMHANLRLVVKMAHQFRVPSHVDRADVIQDGVIGLATAVERFEWRKGYKFSTYATWWIRQAMQKGFQATGSTITIPAHRTSEVRSTIAHLGPDALPENLARIARLTSVDSIDRTDGEGLPIHARATVSDEADPLESVVGAIEHEQVREYIDSLTAEDRHVIMRRFGFDGGEPATYSAIADELGVTREAARRRVLRVVDQARGQYALSA